MKDRNVWERILRPASLIGSLILASAAMAEETDDGANRIEEVIVTATKRSENLSEIPMTISVLGQDDIEVQGINDAGDIARRIPGLVHNQAGKNLVPNFSLRGIAVTTNPEIVNTPVSTYLDDFPITSSNSSTNPEPNLYDVERVEVLKGPQGTLYGSGTLGGIVRVVTNKADPSAFDYSLSTDFGSTSGALRQRYNGMVNIPLQENLALRLVGYLRDEEGWVNNAGTGIDGADQLDESGLRASLRWDASEQFTATLNYVMQESEPEDVALSFDPEEIGVSRSFKPQYSSTELNAYNLTLEYEFDSAMLTSSTNYFKTYSKQENDLSGILAATPFGFPWGMIRDDDHENLIQELRLVSTGDSKFSWVVGAYYANRETDYGQVHTTTPELAASRGLTGFLTNPSISTTDPVFIDATKRVNIDRETAFFGEIGYQLTEDLKFTLGARTGETEVEDTRFAEGIEGISPMIQTNLRWFLGQAGAAPVLDEYELGVTVEPAMRPYGELQDDGTYTNQVWAVQKDYSTFKAALAWQANENMNLYAMVAKGFRGPQINGSATTNGGVSSVDPTDFVIQPSSDSDSLFNYEIGMKAKWLDGRLETNITAYLLAWEDMQQQTVRTSDAASFVSNAGEAETKGLEIEIQALLTDKIDMGLAISTLDAHLTKMSAAEEALTGYQIGVSDQLSAPEFTASGHIQYTTPVFDGNDLYARADVQYVGGYPNKSGFQAGKPGVIDPNAVDTESYENVNVSVGLTSQKWTAALYAENLLDNDNLMYIYPAVFLGSRYGTLRPRTVGLRLSYRL